MLKKSTLVLFSLTLVLACVSSEKMLQRGQYDRAIEKSVKKLRKKPNNEKELYVLNEAYAKANSFDMDRISFLEKEGRDQNYPEIYSLYVRLDNRQNRIKTLPTSLLNQFRLIDYDNKLIASKEQAAEAMYVRGTEYLDMGGRENARKAYYEFEQVKQIYPDYKDVESKFTYSWYAGTNQVLFVIENNSEKVLPERFDEELRKIALAELNSQWIEYNVYEDGDVEYDYFVVLNIKDIEVSPEQVEREKYQLSSEIQDGTKYALDERGNVRKDSLGNDIRVPNMITINAEVNQNRQSKAAFVGGTLDYIDLRTDQLVKTEEIGVTYFFDHYSATFTGDERALTEEAKKQVALEPIPFPPNERMLLDASALLKDKTREIMYKHRRIFNSLER